MKFSIIYECQLTDTAREAEARRFHEMVEQSLLAEEMGFDCIWSVEHHALTQYAHLSAPESFLACIAGRTKRIHVGHGVVCLPFKMNHPIKVAERIATLDILSEGRLEFGVGKGGTVQETGAFGTSLDMLTREVDESMYMIPKMWLDGDFSHESDIITIPPRPISASMRYRSATSVPAAKVGGGGGALKSRESSLRVPRTPPPDTGGGVAAAEGRGDRRKRSSSAISLRRAPSRPPDFSVSAANRPETSR